ncbi:MAG: polyprenyltransferase, partial [Bacteroidetes bacterium]|nr:polyprenyltransferase [Bacteroidota bacterium]
QAAYLGSSLLLTGSLAASLVGLWSGLIALLICMLVLLYDKFAKHHLIFGPFVMGLCRAFNLLLGISIVPQSMVTLWPMGVIPLIFIAAITLTSRGEVIGNNRLAIFLAMFLDALVIGILLFLGTQYEIQLWTLVPFLSLWIVLNFEAKIRAILKNNPPNIVRAVKMGVISLIPLNASFAAGFGGWTFGLFVLALLPLSMLLAKRFAVT